MNSLTFGNTKQSSAFSVVLIIVVAAGAVVVKLTGHTHTEAVRRLKAEESVAAAANRQIFAQQEALENFKKLREEAERDRQFQERISAR